MYLHREEDYGVVEGKGLIIIYTPLRSNMNKGRVRMEPYLGTRSTTFS